MQREDVEVALRRAIERHITENSAMVLNPEGLIELVLEELGMADTTTHNGWTIRRLEGSKLKGTPRGSKHCFGYVATKPGRKDEQAEPSAGHDVPLSSFLRYLDGTDRLHASEHKGEGDGKK